MKKFLTFAGGAMFGAYVTCNTIIFAMFVHRLSEDIKKEESEKT